MRFVPFFVSSYNPKNLPTTSLFESILHKLSFAAIFLFGAVCLDYHVVGVFLFKFLVHFALAKPIYSVTNKSLQSVITAAYHAQFKYL